MKNKNINEESYFERLRELGDVKRQVIKESKTSTLIDHKLAADGRIYGIVKENANYFIKTAIKRNNISEADFAYIGGLSNITEYKCKSLTEAQRVLNTKVMTVNETYGYMREQEPEEEQMPQNDMAPQAEPMPAPAPEAPVESQPEEQPVDDLQPAPAPEAPAVDDETVNQVKSHVGKAGNLLSGIEIPSEKSKQIIKMFLGYFNIEGMSDQDKNELALLFKGENENMEESYQINEYDEFMMTPENISAILGGVSAVFGGAYGINKLMSFIKDKNPKLASEIEKIAKGAGSGIKGGTTSMEESEGYLTEDDEMEDDLIDVMPEQPLDVPEFEDETEMGISGENKVSIDLKSGKVDVTISEAKIKQLAKKYNVSEGYIKWKANDLMNEEIEKAENAEKERLKEEKVRKVVRNIIMEKLGLKKKPLNESVSKERLKLEKLVESVLKKNM